MASSHDVTVSGDWREGDGLHRLPGNAHLLVPGCDGDSLLYLLDAAGRRVLDRLGLPGGGAAAQPRPAGDGRAGGSTPAARCG